MKLSENAAKSSNTEFDNLPESSLKISGVEDSNQEASKSYTLTSSEDILSTIKASVTCSLDEAVMQLIDQKMERKIYDPNTAGVIIKKFIEELEIGSFHYYSRAGKTFYRCEHNLGKDGSVFLQSFLGKIITDRLDKENFHHITSSGLECFVFR